MKNELEFRRAGKKDVPKIIGLLADDELGKKREAFMDPLPQTYYDAFSKIEADQNQELTLVFKETELLACFQLSYIQYLTYQGGMRAQIEAVIVNSNYRGQGIGKIAFEYAIERAKKKGAHVLQLTTDKKRPEALRFYEGLGFVASHEGMKIHF